MEEQPDRENSDPTYDPLDNRGMCSVWLLSLASFALMALIFLRGCS